MQNFGRIVPRDQERMCSSSVIPGWCGSTRPQVRNCASEVRFAPRNDGASHNPAFPLGRKTLYGAARFAVSWGV
jgi:hypothetical protein